MKPFRATIWAIALGIAGVLPSAAEAAWCNVFQVCCHSCRNGAVSGYYAAAAPAACCDPCPD
jgi:hypothetical protein